MEDKELTPPQIQEVPMPVKRDGATYLKVSEAAERLGVHRNTVIHWIKTEQIEHDRLGVAEKSPYIIPIAEIERIIEGGEHH